MSKDGTLSWQPNASIDNLKKRAELMAKIRKFFADRGIVEVETPVMSRTAATDVNLHSFQTQFVDPRSPNSSVLYMVTSPEYHMKRLLAANSGPIYQLGRSFRNEEAGRFHNPEFTMLEWYRPGFDMYVLMNEVEDFLQCMLNCSDTESLSYQEAFRRHLDIDPFSTNIAQLREAVSKIDKISKKYQDSDDKDDLLQLLFAVGIEPYIGQNKPTFIHHFPATQALSAKISGEEHRAAERFEVYFKGIELANGFSELTDHNEQKKRFEQDNLKRAAEGLPQQPIDNRLIAAQRHKSMPECAGVALGVDRLFMLILGAKKLSEVIAFSIDRA